MGDVECLAPGLRPCLPACADAFAGAAPLQCGLLELEGPVELEGEALVYVLEGVGEAVAEGGGPDAFGPDCLLAAVNGLALRPRGPAACLCLLLRGAAPQLAELGPLCRLAPGNPLPAALERLCHILQQGAGSPYAASAAAYGLLMEACALTRRPAPRYRPLVQAAVEHIRQDFPFLEGVQDLADRLGVSPSHLIRTFHADTGRQPGQYLQAVRIDSAKILLLNPAYSVETVAAMVGYSTANYFCRVFRRAAGSPRAHTAKGTATTALWGWTPNWWSAAGGWRSCTTFSAPGGRESGGAAPQQGPQATRGCCTKV